MSGQIIDSFISPIERLKGTETNTHPVTGGVAASAEIFGNVTHVKSLIGNVGEKAAVQGSVQGKSAVVGDLASAYETHTATYEGDYEVTPKVDGQELKTKHKYMTDDVTVHAIPFFEVSNASGGNTVYIAKEIEIE